MGKTVAVSLILSRNFRLVLSVWISIWRNYITGKKMKRLHVIVIISAFGQIIGDLSGDILRAVSSNDVSEVESIIDQSRDNLGSFINTREAGSGQTPLMKSILMGHTDMVRMLLMLPEVDVSLGEKDGYTAFHGAGFQGRAEIAKLLLEDSRNIDPNSFHEDGFAPLHRACWGREQRHVDTIKVLVDSGKVKWNMKTKNGKTCRDIAMSPLIVNVMKEYASKAKKEL